MASYTREPGLLLSRKNAFMDLQTLSSYVDKVFSDATILELPNHYRGKVRDNYDLPDGRRIIIATDRLSAFDINITSIPLKGQVLTQTAKYWFEETRDICPNHVLDYPDPNVVIVKKLSILPVEMVVRDYLTGSTATSIATLYRGGRREMYGIRLPDGLRDNEKLPETIITPTTKAADGDHDAPLTPQDIVERGLLTAAQWETVCRYALALFSRGREIAHRRGLILVDTKYEFGLTDDGEIVLADEIHTPDSSRYWVLNSYEQRFQSGEKPESLDKDFVRNWVAARCDPYSQAIPEIPSDVIAQTAKVYVDAFETITGKTLEISDPDEPVSARIRRNLAPYMTGGF